MAPEQDNIFRLPDLGEGLQEAEIVAWHVSEGEHVAADQPLVSVETDKAVVEIPAPHSGRIARLLGALHERLPIGAPLVAFATEDGTDPGSVVGELEQAPSTGSGARADKGEILPPPPPAKGGGESRSSSGTGHRVGPEPRQRAAPAVRALATELGVDLATITGTGPDGEITRDDLRRHAPATGMVPLRGIRRAMAVRMAEAHAAVVPATMTDEADVESWSPHTPITPRLIAAIAAAAKVEPVLNAAYDGIQMALRRNSEVHVGIAVDTEDGLLVPVLRDAHRLDLASIQAALDTLKEAARTRRVAPDTLRGATITLSNFGPLGGHFAALVVVPPQVAILGAGRIVPRVVPNLHGFAAHRMMPLSLTFDHRAVSGGEAARFLAVVKASLETPSLPKEPQHG